VRLNPDNIKLDFNNVTMFAIILILNVIVLGIASTFLLKIPFIHGLILAIILSSVEYFLVDQLKSEGDLANPLIIFFAFSMLVFYNLEGDMINNMAYLLKYIILGLGIGVLAGIITFRFLKDKTLTKTAELGIIAVALATYIITEQLAGSGLFAVMILGTFFGNSFVRRSIKMNSFSPTIFKTLEMLIYILIGIVATITIKSGIWWKALVLFLIYATLRFAIIHFYYKHYSIENKVLLTFAPKGMVLGVMIIVLGVYSTISQTLQEAMIFILIYSLLAGIFVEYFEQQKELKLDKTLKALSTIRFGRKRDLFRKRR
jgi:NhaP-type Na+/H+ and K+/H+ antiporter